MLSSGTRIGTTRILSWLGEGATGQSYHCESAQGDLKGSLLYVKLIHREISERNGFEDYFHQECQTLEQLEGPGIWPIREFGVMKWKHWIGYEWFEGENLSAEGEGDDDPVIRSLGDLMEFNPTSLTPGLLLDFMISLHRGLYRIHQSGIAHGNLKPSNVLVGQAEDGSGEAWVNEVGLFRMGKFRAIGDEGSIGNEVSSLNQDGRDSREEADRFRPANQEEPDIPDESWDIFALGKIVRWAIGMIDGKAPQWEQWKLWAERAEQVDSQAVFASIAHSMQALPGVGELSEYGIKVENLRGEGKVDLDALREKREREWALAEKVSSVRFRRNMTGLGGGLFALMFLASSLYLFFIPSPWTEYSLENNSDSYKLGAGVLGGQAWGIVPTDYDRKGKGVQDVVGNWTREDGLFKLSFRKFKKINDKDSDKKLWQYIGKGKTSPDDYHIWHDYLRFDRSKGALLLVKRVDEDGIVFVPAREAKESPRLYPEKRLKESNGKLVGAELPFLKLEESGWNWPFFLGFGFLLASFIYHRELRKLETEQAESIE